MRYIDRRFLFPVAAVTAWAQQPSPASPEAEKAAEQAAQQAADAAVRTRAEQFFQLQVEKKYRQGEAFVAEDTKDAYYNGNRYNFSKFTIQKIELRENNTRAVVTLGAKVTIKTAKAGPMEFDAPKTTLWKLENGEWVWYLDIPAVVETPFGPLKTGSNTRAQPVQRDKKGQAPDISTLMSLVKIDRDFVALTEEKPRQTVMVSNDMPGPVDLELGPARTPGFKAVIAKKHLAAGEKTSIQFTAEEGTTAGTVVNVMVSPTGAQLDIRVTRE